MIIQLLFSLKRSNQLIGFMDITKNKVLWPREISTTISSILGRIEQ